MIRTAADGVATGTGTGAAAEVSQTGQTGESGYSDKARQADGTAKTEPTQDRAERLGSLLTQAQAGDRERLHEIVAELTPLLWHVARCQGLVHNDAEDVVQSVWLSLVARLAHIETPVALIGWLVTATKRESWRLGRSLDRTRSIGAEELAGLVDPAEPAEERVIADERLRFVREALERLTPRCAELLRMLAVTDRPNYDAVAQSLGMPRGSVGPNRGRCLAKLRAILLADTRWSALCP
jgi:RNA polymerase sigma factor (sigma-70 family)